MTEPYSQPAAYRAARSYSTTTLITILLILIAFFGFGVSPAAAQDAVYAEKTVTASTDRINAWTVELNITSSPDTYPHPYDFFSPQRFQALEKRLIDWRWKLRDYTHRLSATHGDFHPWNVLVRENGDFSVLDINRGEWGEPADDMATMSCNYLLFGLYDKPFLSGHFADLFSTFWDRYLEKTGDMEMLQVVAPYYVFRGLVIASPEWYPSHPSAVREGLFRFLENVLQDDVFDYKNVNRYMK